MILKNKNEILNWLEQYDSEYQVNMENHAYELIDIHDDINKILLEEMMKKDALASDYFENFKKEGNHYIVNVNGNCNISGNYLEIIPIQFYHVEKNFSCSDNKLTSLKGCPQSISGHFYCSHNQLTSLKYCPQIVGGNFVCAHNQLTSLKGCPQHVHGSFSCSHNQLTSLEYGPQSIGGHFYCDHNQLTSLKDCPQSIGATFSCDHNQLKTLEYFPKNIQGYIYLYDNTQLLKYKTQLHDFSIQNMLDGQFLNQKKFSFWHQFHLQEKINKENKSIIDNISLDEIKENNHSNQPRIKKV